MVRVRMWRCKIKKWFVDAKGKMIAKLGNPIKNFFSDTQKKIIAKFGHRQHNPIVFLNSPIAEENQDVIGIKSASDAIVAAVKQSAHMIGLIADYGAGKSSLTEMLANDKRRFKKVIRINMWDTISRLRTTARENVGDTIDSLTKSFIFQLAAGVSENTAKYINRRLSKNYGIISFSLSTPSFWGWFIGAMISGVLYAILAHVEAITLGNAVHLILAEPALEDIIKYAEIAKSGAYVFLALGLLLLLFGMRYTNVAYSYWKSRNLEPELNDIFEAYFYVHKMLQRKRKHNLIVIEDLDRICDKELVIGFLREIYRFASLTPKGKKNSPVFLIAVMPEVNLIDKNQVGETTPTSEAQKENGTIEKRHEESVYEKIFDYTINLRPIHFEDYAEILLNIIGDEASPNRKAINSLLDGKKIGEKLPSTFNWLVKGHNLTIRQLKERLNSAVSLLVTLKNKGYENQSYISFSSCAAVTYLEHQYPHIFYTFVSRENELSKLVQQVLEAKNSSDENIDAFLSEFFKKEIFGQYEDVQKMQDDVKEMLLCGDIADDFRMYFYSFPKKSYIKNSDERDIYNLLVWPKEYAFDEELDNKVNRLVDANKTGVVDSTIKALIESDTVLPQVILKNEYLFKIAFSESPIAVLKCAKRYISWQPNKLQDSQALIEYIYSYGVDAYRDFWNGYAYLLSNAFADIEDKLKIDIRYRLVCVLSEDIAIFRGLYEKLDEKPLFCIDTDAACSEFVLISEKELNRIPTRDIAIELINIELMQSEDVDYISNYLNAECISAKSIERTVSIYKHISELVPSTEYWEKVLVFLRTNKIVEDELFTYILSGISAESEEHRGAIGEYLCEVCPEDVSDKYYSLIDEYVIDRALPENVVRELYERQLLTAHISFCTHENKLHNFDFTLDSYVDAIKTACLRLNDRSPHCIPLLRKELLIQHKVKDSLDSFCENFGVLFYGDYPLITMQEMETIPDAVTILRLLNRARVKIDDCDDINLQLNKKVDSAHILTFFRFLLSTEYNDKFSDSTVANHLVDSIDYRVIDFSDLNYEDISKIVEYVGLYRDFNNSDIANKFMLAVDCLIPQLERVVAAGSITVYAETLLKIGKPSDYSLQWVDENEITFALPEKVLEHLLNTGKTQKYLVAKVLLQKEFSFPFPLVPDSVVVAEYNLSSPIWEHLKDDTNLIEHILKNELFKGFDSKDYPEILKPLYKGKQTVEFVSHVLEHLDADDQSAYLLEMGEIVNEENSALISKLLVEDRYIALLQDDAVFWKVYERLWENAPKHSGHKSYFSKKRNEWIKSK